MPDEVACSKINVTHGGQALSLRNSFVQPKEQRTEFAGRNVHGILLMEEGCSIYR